MHISFHDIHAKIHYNTKIIGWLLCILQQAIFANHIYMASFLEERHFSSTDIYLAEMFLGS